MDLMITKLGIMRQAWVVGIIPNLDTTKGGGYIPKFSDFSFVRQPEEIFNVGELDGDLYK